MYRIGFIGCGNMGSALARAVSLNADPKEILLSSRTKEKAASLAAELGCSYGSNTDVAEKCRYIFLGVKPLTMKEMLKPLQEIFLRRYENSEEFILVSMAAGLKIADIQDMANGTFPVIRIMPNTPVSVQKGMTLVCASREVPPDSLKEFDQIMSSSGRLDHISENLIDAAGAVSGCGPAFVYMFIEAMSDGAVECGLPRQNAVEYTCQTLIGAASMVLESGSNPGSLKDAVCSPAGTTIAGVHALEKAGMRGGVMDAVKAAYEKTVKPV